MLSEQLANACLIWHFLIAIYGNFCIVCHIWQTVDGGNANGTQCIFSSGNDADLRQPGDRTGPAAPVDPVEGCYAGRKKAVISIPAYVTNITA